MSRLPRLHSSPDRLTGPSMASSTTLKRKAALENDNDDDEAADQPRKLPAIASSLRNNEPLRPSRKGTNTNAPPPLTKPRAPTLSTSRTTRATSAPPKSTGVRASRSVSSTSTNTRPIPRTTTSRVVSNPDNARFADFQSQLTSLESARAADSARIAAEMAAERQKVAELQSNTLALSRDLAAAKSAELDQRKELVCASDEIDTLKKRHAREVGDMELDLRRKEREARELSEDLRNARADLERERETVSALKSTISQNANAQLTLTAQVHALQAQLSALRAQLDGSTSSASSLQASLECAHSRVAELEREAMESEAVRRKLHNMVQELKGNIRVFCRVRPALSGEEEKAQIGYPDKEKKEIVLSSVSENAMGQERKEVYNFGFDRVFGETSTQSEVFEEISQLAQSCTDGYNVCIFAYGQTGSGKSFTMEGGPSEESKGMIPRAVDQVFRVTEELKGKGWEYTMEGQFLEIYNETINDLLGSAEFDKKKHEIKHDPTTHRTTVTDLAIHALPSASAVRTLLARAQSRRSVAATLMNERSSRSHSVFTLRIKGENRASGERCEGCLNLVDLAGSERLNGAHGGGDGPERGERVKETKSINRSLSALGDVVAALGEKEGKGDKHVPYRNSKLTYLLQNSLSGNSKTLMVLNLSPLAAHLNESLTSLRFATKVNNTTIGTAKKSRLS